MKKHRFLCTLFGLVIACFVFFVALQPIEANATTSGYYTYTVKNGTATITDVDTSISGDIMIPSTLGGYPVTSIGNSAFYYCTSLTSVTIPDSVTRIDTYAFGVCDNLTSVTIGKGLTSMSNRTFDLCANLTGIWVDSENPAYSSDEKGVLFNKKKTELRSAPRGITGSYIIPDSVTYICAYAFSDCTGLTAITIPEGVTTIKDYAFNNCKGLTQIQFNATAMNNLSTNNYVFYGAAQSGLGITLTIGANVTKIPAYLFYPDTPVSYSSDFFPKIYTVVFEPNSNCKSIETYAFPSRCNIRYVIFCGTEKQWNNIEIVSYNQALTSAERSYHSWKNATCVDPKTCQLCGKVEGTLKAHSYVNGICTVCDNMRWLSYEIADDHAIITACSTEATGSLEIPDTIMGFPVTYIYDSAFSGCAGVTGVMIPSSVTGIGKYAFYDCTGLTSVTYCGTEEQWNTIEMGAFNTQLIDAARNYHNWSDWSVRWQPTCSEEGSEMRTCQICSERDTRPIPVVDHTWDDWKTSSQATCTQEGIAVRTCQVCSQQDTKAIPVVAHTWGDWATSLEPTCTQEGIAVRTCQICSQQDTKTIPVVEHIWCDWVTLVEATCTQDGIQGRMCQNCSAQQTDSKAALGHSYSLIVTAPTCTHGGYTTYVCTACNDSYIGDQVNAVGHSYSSMVIAPTCTEDGYTKHTCSACGDSYIDSNVAANGHNWSTWIVLTEPSCTTDGSQSRFCSCGTTEKESIPATGHSYEDHICTVCGDMLTAFVEQWNICIKDNIGVNFYIFANDDVLAQSQVKVAVGDETVTYDLSQLTLTEYGYQVVANVGAAQMTQQITVEIITDGVVAESKTYTIRQYADYIFAGDYSNKTKNMVRYMLIYGAMAQKYFGYNEGTLANADVNCTLAAVPTTEETSTGINGAIDGISFYGASLRYDSRIALRYYFEGNATGCTFTVNGAGLAPVQKDGRYYVEIPEILPQDLDEVFSITVEDGNGKTMIVTYNPLNYIVRMYTKANATEETKNLLQALYTYHLATEIYTA